jgi:uncharacterized membrane protein YagU involved in acid resistance
MRSSKKSPNPKRKTPFQLIQESLRETNIEGRENLSERLGNRKGKMSQVKHFLFLHPTFHFLSTVTIGVIIIYIASIVGNLEMSNEIRLALVLIFISLYAAWPIFLNRVTPKFDMSFEETWGRVVGKYLWKTGYNLVQAERSIKREILRYKRESRPVNFIVNLLWGGVIIGCLPDPIFQKALMTTSLVEILNTNPFGGVCIILMPFIYQYYFVNYDIPIAWMESAVDQIELEKIDTTQGEE